MNAFYLFSVRGIPVYVQPFYFVLLAFFCFQSELFSGLVFCACVTVSLLVHEFGHALVAAHYRLNPTVILHGWGGLCAHERAEKDGHDAFIVAAGPAAGFAFGLLMLASALIAPEFIEARPVLKMVVRDLIFINIIWSIFNILPLWPLDGGQLIRLGILRFVSPITGERIVHGLGIAIVVLLGFATWYWTLSGFTLLILALLGYENFKQLQSKRPSGAIRKRYSHTNKLLDAAWEAMATAHYEEAARIGYQIRAEPKLTESLDEKAWEVIALATLLQGKLDEGLRYAQRASQSPRLIAACINAHLIKGDVETARSLSKTRAFRKLSLKVRQELARRFEAVSGS